MYKIVDRILEIICSSQILDRILKIRIFIPLYEIGFHLFLQNKTHKKRHVCVRVYIGTRVVPILHTNAVLK